MDLYKDENPNEILEAFNVFDVNRDGALDFYELKVALKALGVDKSKDEINAALDGSTSITYEKFEKLATEGITKRNPMIEMERAFRLFDGDNSGKINLRKLKRVAREIGQHASDEELTGMIEQFDLNGDGEIDFEEFKQIMNYGRI